MAVNTFPGEEEWERMVAEEVFGRRGERHLSVVHKENAVVQKPHSLGAMYYGVNTCTTDTRRSSEILNFARRHGWKSPRLSRSMYLTWAYRYEIEHEGCERASVNAVPLTPDAPMLLAQVYKGFVYLFECRWLHTRDEPAPFIHEFSAVWCGVTERQARTARAELQKQGLMVYAGKHGRAKLWLPREA
jgi:hypothetical protein